MTVLDGVSQFQPIGVSQLARDLEMNKATTQRALVELDRHGWIQRAPENENHWILTTKALTIGSRHRGSSDLRAIARPVMEDLAERTGETIHLTILDGVEAVLIERIESESALRTHARIGDRGLLHFSASGLAMMAALPADELEILIKLTTERIDASNRPFDWSEVMAQLEKVQACGYATVEGTRHPDVSAIAAAVLNLSGSPIASISISMPTQRLSPELVDPWGQAVIAAARQCGLFE